MKVALVYDRVNKFGGAERVLLMLHQLFPDAPLYTLVYDKEKAKWASEINVVPTFLNKLPFLRNKHELLAPISPLAFETHDLSRYEVVISITSSDSKSVITRPDTLHICYCLTPTRYYWSGEEGYGQDIKMKLLPGMIKKYLRTVDLLTSQRPDEYIAISNEVSRRIKKYYLTDSHIVYPSIEDKFYTDSPLKKDARKYYLIVSRLVPYKKVDLAIKAFNFLQKRLIIVGTGSEVDKLKKMAMDNIEFVGSVTDEELIKYYSKAKAVIFPQDEDFGLVPLEAQACGTPVIAYAKGGALETVEEGKTGLFFGEQTEDSLIEAVKKFEELEINYFDCVDQAKKFSQSKFMDNFSGKVAELWQKHQAKIKHPRS